MSTLRDVSAVACRVALALTCAQLASAQRFDNWVWMPTITNSAGSAASLVSPLVTDPVSGAPTGLINGAGLVETAMWTGTAFTSVVGAGAPVASGFEAMSAFSTLNGAGFVYLDSSGATSVLPAGGTWTSLGGLTPSPVGRIWAATTTAVGPTGRAYLFGGHDGTAARNDLWSFDGAAWTNITPAAGPQPSPRFGAAITVDGVGGLLLVGGQTAFGQLPLDDVWRFDGTIWSLVAKAPFHRAFHALVLDISRAEVLALGGTNNANLTPCSDVFAMSLWTSDLTGPWYQLPSSLTSSSLSAYSYAALDRAHNEPILADAFSDMVQQDQVASGLPIASSPTSACIVPGLQLEAGSVPRIGLTPQIGGILGAAGVPVLIQGAFVTPGIGLMGAPTPLGGTCFSFLPANATTIAVVTSQTSGVYKMPFAIPNSVALVGIVLDLQSFAVVPAGLAASNLMRMVIGR